MKITTRPSARVLVMAFMKIREVEASIINFCFVL